MIKEKYVKNGVKVIDIDGARVVFEDGWGLIRASNTGPNLTIKSEATSELRRDEIINQIKEYIEQSEKELNK